MRRRFTEARGLDLRSLSPDPVMLVADAFRFRDQRNVMLAGFFIVAGVAEYLAVFQGRFAAQAIGDIMVKVKLDAKESAARRGFAFARGTA